MREESKRRGPICEGIGCFDLLLNPYIFYPRYRGWIIIPFFIFSKIKKYKKTVFDFSIFDFVAIK